MEALRFVHGVTDSDLANRASLEVGEWKVLVPLPWVLLKGKLANALGLNQGDRQDVKHVRLLAVVIREYLAGVATHSAPEQERVAT